MLNYYYYKKDELYCEDVSISGLIKEVGTPLFVYSKNSIITQFEKLKNAFNAFNTKICYAVKSNSNINILNLLHKQGAGMDIISGGELFRVRKAGIQGNHVVFSGPGKTSRDIQEALEADIFMFNVESLP